MENNMTAVEWLLEQTMYIRSTKWPDIVEQAKAMEKEQIIEAYTMGSYDMAEKEFRPEQYYNETYGKRNTHISEGVDQPGLPEGRE